MKKYIVLSLIALGLIACTSTPKSIKKDTNSTIENNTTIEKKKKLTVDLDKELIEQERKGDSKKIIPIFIGEYKNDNDEVAFTGNILKQNSPIKIKIGDNDEVAFTGKEYIIQTSELKDGDLISIKDKNGNIFATMRVREF